MRALIRLVLLFVAADMLFEAATIEAAESWYQSFWQTLVGRDSDLLMIAGIQAGVIMAAAAVIPEDIVPEGVMAYVKEKAAALRAKLPGKAPAPADAEVAEA